MIWFSSHQSQIHHGSVEPVQPALCPLSWDSLLGRRGAGRSGPAQWVWEVGMECSSLGRRGQQVGRWASLAAEDGRSVSRPLWVCQTRVCSRGLLAAPHPPARQDRTASALLAQAL